MVNICFGATAYGPLWAPAVTTWLRVVGVTARQVQIQQVGRIPGAGVTDRTYTMTAENQLVELASLPRMLSFKLPQNSVINLNLRLARCAWADLRPSRWSCLM